MSWTVTWTLTILPLARKLFSITEYDVDGRYWGSRWFSNTLEPNIEFVIREMRLQMPEKVVDNYILGIIFKCYMSKHYVKNNRNVPKHVCVLFQI